MNLGSERIRMPPLLTNLLTGHFCSCPTLQMVIRKILSGWEKKLSLWSLIFSLIRRRLACKFQNSLSFFREVEEDKREKTTESRDQGSIPLSQSLVVKTLGKAFHLRRAQGHLCPAKVWTHMTFESILTVVLPFWCNARRKPWSFLWERVYANEEEYLPSLH